MQSARSRDTQRILVTAFYFCAVAVLILALMPAQSAPGMDWDKANHSLAFGVLGVLGVAAWPRHPFRLLLGLVLFGIGIEIAQAFTPDRTPDVMDVVADTIAAVVAIVAAKLVARAALRKA